ncbi:MAG: hypothetical protein AAF787_21475 [Chloroflexota bacterium]
MRIKRRNVVWLGTLGALTAIAVLSQGFDSGASILLLSALGLAGGVALFDVEPQQLIKTVQERTVLGGKTSADAREAAERAKARGMISATSVQLLDVGLIALHERYDGMVMQRTRSLSLDDNSVRPYVTLQVPALDADRHAVIRFEIDDGDGDRVYSHEKRQYMRDGKLDIMADTQMPLFDSTMGLNPGECDLRVYVDGDLVGILGFTLSPSVRDRWAGRREKSAESRLRDDAPADPVEDDVPMSLEDLLRQQSNRD